MKIVKLNADINQIINEINYLHLIVPDKKSAKIRVFNYVEESQLENQM